MPVLVKTEYLEINGVPLATPAWRITDLTALYDAPEVKGDDLDVSHGVMIPKLRRVTRTRKVFPMVIYGQWDQEGNFNGDNARLGLLTNVDYLLTNVVLPSAVGDGTHTAIWHLPGGGTRTAQVHVIPPLRLGAASRTSQLATLDISVPAGRFV